MQECKGMYFAVAAGAACTSGCWGGTPALERAVLAPPARADMAVQLLLERRSGVLETGNN